ncbi:uncharacterized protein LOC117174393 isoform X2 [Belonocnema kinseyi]|uniref:uncharacterized protein LOC117174393 isoform X2 n=1 Tax=Belonocnema kinseyi TaxID=2817044 RepID=UPI00143CF978|nr:uncharacterized protein LOC117174393 isoform X2 [Belonocnema kinseyi]
MFNLLARVCLAATIPYAAVGVLPSYIKPCKKLDPDINNCITHSIEDLRSQLAQGIPELDAPAIEPLKLKQIRLLKGPIGARLDINITDLVVTGPSSFKVRELKADVDEVSFTFKVSFDKLSFRGQYQIDARILLLTLTGSGDLTGDFTGYDSNVILRAHKVFRDNDVYLTFDKMKLAIRIGAAKVHLNNLFGGDPILERVSVIMGKLKLSSYHWRMLEIDEV